MPGTIIIVDNPDATTAHSIELATGPVTDTNPAVQIDSGSSFSEKRPESKAWLRADMFNEVNILQIEFDEDLNQNGALDLGEDVNGNGSPDTVTGYDVTSITYNFETDSGSYRVDVERDLETNNMVWKLNGSPMLPCKPNSAGPDGCEHSGVPELMLGDLDSWSAKSPKGNVAGGPAVLRKARHQVKM